jgi:acetyltransferase-like isoleucine patch superfamily enzyme
LPVVICDNVFIGYGAIILPGVVVNTGSIVGAGAVVTKDVPEMSVVAGNPARVIGERDRPELSRYIKDREAGELL